MERQLQSAAVFGLAALAIVTMAFNATMQADMRSELHALPSYAPQAVNAGTGETTKATGAKQGEGTALAFGDFLPKGVPPVYGKELGVSFDDPVTSLDKLRALDGDLYKEGKIKFSDLGKDEQQSYLKIGMSIACEYCCDAKALVFSNGQPACGCAHSAAMRGLAKYLLENHRNEMTDQQVLDELAKWKTTFFPKQMYAKALAAQASGQGSSPSVLGNVPDMVGGC